MDAAFEEQIRLGLNQELHGWDFSWLSARTREEALPWDYRSLALEHIRGTDSLLDIGTGGGEFLAALFTEPGANLVDGAAVQIPPLTWASEGYPPNLPIARERLAPLGIQVADTSAPGEMPFPPESFSRIIDRHEGIPGAELARLLKPGGRYLTQQVGGENCIEFNQFLGGPDPTYRASTLAATVQDLETAGLRILQAREALPAWVFSDLAGVIFYLGAIPWQIPGYSVDGYREALRALDAHIRRTGSFTVHAHRLLIEAEKPPLTNLI